MKQDDALESQQDDELVPRHDENATYKTKRYNQQTRGEICKSRGEMTIEKYTVVPLVLNLPLHIHNVRVEIHVANLTSSLIGFVWERGGFFQRTQVLLYIHNTVQDRTHGKQQQSGTYSHLDLLFLVLVTFGWVAVLKNIMKCGGWSMVCGASMYKYWANTMTRTNQIEEGCALPRFSSTIFFFPAYSTRHHDMTM